MQSCQRDGSCLTTTILTFGRRKLHLSLELSILVISPYIGRLIWRGLTSFLTKCLPYCDGQIYCHRKLGNTLRESPTCCKQKTIGPYKSNLTGYCLLGVSMLYVLVAVSCECPEYPEEKKYVRGWNYPCGVVVIKYPQ